jgi:hypothetical protein
MKAGIKVGGYNIAVLQLCSSRQTIPPAAASSFQLVNKLVRVSGTHRLPRIPLCPGTHVDALRLHLVNDDV